MHSKLVRKSKLYSNFPNDPIITGSCCKQKYKSFSTSVINKLNSLHDTDSNAYWKLLKELQDDKQSDQSEKISSEQWVKHFSKLALIKNLAPKINTLKNCLLCQKNQKHFLL